ncbi:hypothetical protein [Deinococcus sp.]|uniref:hypothetical protein n=1 Tax=Deinococcus sp. TaxID=47478 RepID=UPI003B5B43CA
MPKKVVMLLGNKKRTSTGARDQATFKRRMKYFAAWTALLLALTGLVTAIVELAHFLATL